MVRSGTGGSIITIASVAGLIGISGRVAYTAAKHGVVGITRTLARDLASHHIRVNALCPGLVRTPLNDSYFADEAFVRSVANLVPLGAVGHPSHIAQAAVFLASDMSSYVTGIALPVDGGWLAERAIRQSRRRPSTNVSARPTRLERLAVQPMALKTQVATRADRFSTAYRRLQRFREGGLVVALLLTGVGFTLVNSTFAESKNLQNIASQISFVGVVGFR